MVCKKTLIITVCAVLCVLSVGYFMYSVIGNVLEPTQWLALVLSGLGATGIIWIYVRERIDPRNHIEAFAHLATIVGVFTTLVLSIVSLTVSIAAHRLASDLSEEARKIDVKLSWQADERQELQLISPSPQSDIPVIQLYGTIRADNLNAYRRVTLRNLDAEFENRVKSSQLTVVAVNESGEHVGITSWGIEPSFSVDIRVRITWPVPVALRTGITDYFESQGPHTIITLRTHIGTVGVQQTLASKHHRKVYFRAKTSPASPSDSQPETVLILF